MPEVSAADRVDPPVLYVLVGLPASGNTTLALELAATLRALLLSPDEWMIPLFGQPDTDGRRDVLEGRLRRAPESTYPISEADLAAWLSLFEAPDSAELSGTEPLEPPPSGFDSWPDWAADRWPSLYPASSRTGTP